MNSASNINFSESDGSIVDFMTDSMQVVAESDASVVIGIRLGMPAQPNKVTQLVYGFDVPDAIKLLESAIDSLQKSLNTSEQTPSSEPLAYGTGTGQA